MNNLEKKLDALIDALGFDVEEVASDVFIGNYDGEDMYIPQFTGYKLTKRKPDITKQLVMNIIELSKLDEHLQWIKYPKKQFDDVISWFGSAAKKQSADHYYIYGVSVEVFNENI